MAVRCSEVLMELFKYVNGPEQCGTRDIQQKAPSYGLSVRGFSFFCLRFAFICFGHCLELNITRSVLDALFVFILLPSAAGVIPCICIARFMEGPPHPLPFDLKQ